MKATTLIALALGTLALGTTTLEPKDTVDNRTMTVYQKTYETVTTDAPFNYNHCIGTTLVDGNGQLYQVYDDLDETKAYLVSVNNNGTTRDYTDDYIVDIVIK